MPKYIPETGDLNKVVMTGDELMGAVESNVRTFSTDFKTDCVFVGDGAATDGDTVFLPSMQGDADITQRQALVLNGYALHETLHKLLTDFRYFRRKIKKWGPFTKAMHNAIEDIRIEHGGQDLYNGLSKQVDKTAREVNRQFIDNVYPQNPEIVNDFGKIGPVAVTWAGRKALGYQDESNEEALSLLPDDIRKRVERIAQQAMKLDHGVRGMGDVDQRAAYNGCKKGGELAERITKQMMEELQQQQQQEGQGNGNGEAQDNDASGSGQEADGGGNQDERSNEQGNSQTSGEEGENQGEAGGGESGNEMTDKSSDEPANGEDSDGGDIGDAGGGAVQQEEPEPLDPNLDVAASRVIDEVNSKDYHGYRVWAPNCDELNTRLVTQPESYYDLGSPVGREYYDSLKRNAGGNLATIRRKLERVLLEMKDTLWENGARSGRLDVQRNAAKIIQFKPNVFRRRQDETNVNSALMILSDASGSMAGEKLTLAATATISICEALEPTGVPVEVISHYTGEVPMRTASDRRKGRMNMAREFGRGSVTVQPGYGRYNKICYFLHKSFDETLMQARGALGLMSTICGGANADGDAIRFAAKRLLERPEPRKVMLVLSDGAPAWYSDTHNKHQWTRDCVEWVKHQGIEIVGLGILDASVRKYYPNHVVVHNMDDFSKTYIDEVAKLILGKGNHNGDLMTTGVRRGSKL